MAMLTAREICSKWDVSRATFYRRLAAYKGRVNYAEGVGPAGRGYCIRYDEAQLSAVINGLPLLKTGRPRAMIPPPTK